MLLHQRIADLFLLAMSLLIRGGLRAQLPLQVTATYQTDHVGLQQ
jgi:hypothetical protein